MGKRLPIKYARRTKNAGVQPAKSLRIKIVGRHDLEQLSFALQRAIARLQDEDVRYVENVSVYLTPLNGSGDRMMLKDAKGKLLETLEIHVPVSARFLRATAA